VLTSNFTPTVDVGTITTMTVRGVVGTTLPLTFSRIGNVVTILIPGFEITADTSAPFTINVTGIGSIPALYRPSFQYNQIISIEHATTFVTGIILVSVGGLIQIQRQTGTTFNPSYGTVYDTAISYVIP